MGDYRNNSCLKKVAVVRCTMNLIPVKYKTMHSGAGGGREREREREPEDNNKVD